MKTASIYTWESLFMLRFSVERGSFFLYFYVCKMLLILALSIKRQ